jgi:hypothetical protein
VRCHGPNGMQHSDVPLSRPTRPPPRSSASSVGKGKIASNRVRFPTFAGALIVAAGVALAVAATPAHADEDSYVAQLDRHGVYYASILDVIDLGKLSCHRMRSGMTMISTLDEVVVSGYSRQEAVWIVASAVSEMCPDQFYRTQKFHDDNIG